MSGRPPELTMNTPERQNCGTPQRIDGTLSGVGFLLVQITARSPGSSGTLVVDIRRTAGGGSLRAARASVNHDLPCNHITMPHGNGEEFIIFLENVTGAPPEISCRRVVVSP